MSIFINVLDVNEPPSFTNSTYTVSTSENSHNPSMFSVGSPRISDVDFGHIDTLIFSIVTFIPANGSRFFSMNSASGVISVNAGTDYENTKAFHLLVKATDEEGLEDSSMVNVIITDVNEPPTLRTLPQYHAPENNASAFANSYLYANEEYNKLNIIRPGKQVLTGKSP